MKTLLVSAIKDGTVIDHIYTENALKIIRILNLPMLSKTVTVGLNLHSQKSDKVKDIIKVEERELTDEEVDRVAILAPNATINIIRNYEVIKKSQVKIPKKIKHVVVCPNPKCITNNDDTETVFKVIANGDHMKLQCHYCEKIFMQKEIREYKNN
ncbi:MAG: aspartate carbamoyltransferase regulatory subunit [bacterium]